MTNPEVAAALADAVLDAADLLAEEEFDWEWELLRLPWGVRTIEVDELGTFGMFGPARTVAFHRGALLLDWIDASPQEGAVACAFLNRDCTGLTGEDVRAVVAGLLAKPG